MTRSLLTLALAAASLAASAQSPPAPAPTPLPEVAVNVGKALETACRLAEVARVATQLFDLSATMRPGDALVLLATPDGVRAVPVTDEPLVEQAALIVYDDGAWSLRTLSPGDIPSEVAQRPFPAIRSVRPPRPIRPMPPMSPRYGDTAGSDRQRGAVAFSVSGRFAGDATAFLVDLAETDALESLSASSVEGGSQVDARFGFASMEEWAAWRARPQTDALLAALSGGPGGVQTRLDRSRR